MNVLQLDIIIKRKSLDDIFKEVCIATKVVPFEIRSSSREYDVKTARHIFFYIAHKHTKIQLEVIGRYLNRHHATVLHGYHKISNQLIYKDISNLVDEIEEKLKTNK
jgi:chromosomal replication initiation ATPase DnaA